MARSTRWKRPAASTRCSWSLREDEQAQNNGAKSLTIATNKGDQVPVKARLFTSPWNGESALVLMLTGAGGDVNAAHFEAALKQARAEAGELRAILDTAAGGVVLIDGNGQIISVNGSAEVLFGYESRELAGLAVREPAHPGQPAHRGRYPQADRPAGRARRAAT